MKYICVIILGVVALSNHGLSAPGSDETIQEQLQNLANVVQRLQGMSNGYPGVQDLSQKVLNQLSQFTGSRLFFANPCSFFQSMFRSFYCTISSFDPTGRNPAVQGLLQFLNTNAMFFNFAQNFFCPFAAFGGGSSGSSSANTPITCPASSSSNGLTGFADLDNPTEFAVNGTTSNTTNTTAH